MPQNLKQLTSLRFFAAMWVVFYLYWPALRPSSPAFIAKGHLGVDLFFVLSGFILSHVYLAAFGEKRARYAPFLWARLARIYPVHIAILIGLALLIGGARVLGQNVGDKMVVLSSLPAQILLLQAWGLSPQGGWNHPSWSISAEWFAYLCFPAFAWVFWRLRSRPWLGLLGASVLVIVLNVGFAYVTGEALTDAAIEWGALRIVPSFALGCALYLLWSSGVLQARRAAFITTLIALSVAVAATSLGAPDWLTILAFGGLILGLAGLAGHGSGLLAAPFWVYLGEVSFALYMICIPWQLVFQRGAQQALGLEGELLPPTVWAAMLLGVIPAAMVIHHLIERPARHLMRRHGGPLFRKKAARGVGAIEPTEPGRAPGKDD